MDVVLIANEVVDEKKRPGEERVVFKIDFEKYDHVDWGFWDHVLERKGFSAKWRSWMKGCLSSMSDPLSPFVFTIVVDALSKMMIRAEERGLFEGFTIGRDGSRVSLLQFAEDTYSLLKLV